MDKRSMTERPLAQGNKLFPVFHAGRVVCLSFKGAVSRYQGY